MIYSIITYFAMLYSKTNWWNLNIFFKNLHFDYSQGPFPGCFWMDKDVLFTMIIIFIYLVNALYTKVKQNCCKIILFSIHRLLDISLCCCYFFVLTCKPCPHLFLGSRWRSPKPFREAFGMLLLQALSLFVCLFVALSNMCTHI